MAFMRALKGVRLKKTIKAREDKSAGFAPLRKRPV